MNNNNIKDKNMKDNNMKDNNKKDNNIKDNKMNNYNIDNEIINNAKDLLNLIDKSPTAYHVIENAKAILKAAGFKSLKEKTSWNLQAGENYYVSRNDSSLIAFSIPKPDYKGFRIIASHSDSPCPKLKEDFEYRKDGYVRLNVEKYGGMLLAPWFDRPLSIAGRILVRDENGISPVLVNLDKDVAVIPSLAIHMNRDANSGYSYSFQKDMLPIVSTSDGKKEITLITCTNDNQRSRGGRGQHTRKRFIYVYS